MTETHIANGAKFLAKDDMIVRWERKEKKVFEPETYAFMKGALDSGRGIFVDVGASTGWFSIPFALQGHKVMAFDPNQRAVQRLCQNRDLNGISMDQLHVVPAAASDKDGETTFWYNPSLPLTSGGSIEATTCGKPAAEVVMTVTIDSMVTEKVGVLKIDVEGHEMSVLKGAHHIIEMDQPYLVLEANTEKHFKELEAWLNARKYTHRRADQRNILATPTG